jgi:hypothetical protein
MNPVLARSQGRNRAPAGPGFRKNESPDQQLRIARIVLRHNCNMPGLEENPPFPDLKDPDFERYSGPFGMAGLLLYP